MNCKQFRLSRYFRISLTNKCNLNCFFCHNEGQPRYFVDECSLSVNDFIWISAIAKEYGFIKFKLTGGEPTLYKGLVQVISGLKENGITDISLITNGIQLKSAVSSLRNAGLSRLNVTIFTLDAEKFIKENGGSGKLLKLILYGIEEAISVGFNDLKINYIWHNFNRLDDFLTIAQFAESHKLTIAIVPLINQCGKRLNDYFNINSIYDALKELGIADEQINYDGELIKRRQVWLSRGTSILLRMECLGEIAPYPQCGDCSLRLDCQEGIFPIRLSASGEVRPCLAEGRAPINLFNSIKRRDRSSVLSAFEKIFNGIDLSASEIRSGS